MFIFCGWPLIIVADIGLAALLDFGRCPLGFEIVPESLAPIRFLDRVRFHSGGPGLLFVFLAHGSAGKEWLICGRQEMLLFLSSSMGVIDNTYSALV